MSEPVEEVPEPKPVLKSLYQAGRVQNDNFSRTEPGNPDGMIPGKLQDGVRDGPAKTRGDYDEEKLVRSRTESNVGQQHRTAEKVENLAKMLRKRPS